MTEEDSKKPILFQGFLLLAVPALLYFTGYAYWDGYLTMFSFKMNQVQLPVYTVMFHSWYVLVSIAYIFIWLWGFILIAKIAKDTVTLPKGVIFIILSLVCLFICDLLFTFRVSYIASFVFLFFGIVLVRIGRQYHRRFPERKLTFAHARIYIPGALLAIVCVLYTLAFMRGMAHGARIIKGEWNKKPMVEFHFTSQQNPTLPDSLFLLISSDYYHFVLAPPGVPNGKPKVYAINKDLISHFEILQR